MTLGLVALSAAPVTPARAQESNQAKPNKDWPCRQILVEKISLPAIWSGPPIENIDWRKNPAMVDRVNALAARRLPLEDAEREVRNFAAGFNASRQDDRKAELTALFAGLFETLSGERAQVVGGLVRFGRRQKELAEKIRSENAATHTQAPAQAVAPESAAKVTEADPRALEWDLRIFDERRQALSYVCETPTLIEQRLFALARVIQQNLD
jgi:hypothetical protein